ncbi:MAG: sugar phosphate isomerase/epimerase family protein [Armatimonadota bacterium]
MQWSKIGFVASLGFARQNPGDVAKSLSDTGYTGVEWTIGHFNPRAKSLSELRDMVRIVEEYGITSTNILAEQDFITMNNDLHNDRIQMVQECIRASAECGIKMINLFTGPAPWDPSAPVVGRDISEGDAWGLLYDAMDKIIPVAEEHNVHLTIEAVFGMLCRDYYTTKVLFDHYDSEYLCINMDPSHYRLYRNDPSWAAREWGSKVKHVHLKDVIGLPGPIGDSFIFPLLGEGLVDWKTFLRTLTEIGYDGYLSVEFESFKYYTDILGGDPVRAAQLSMDNLKTLMEGVD